jgi:hypothetical protein
VSAAAFATPQPELVICQFQDEADTLEQLEQPAVVATDPHLLHLLQGRKLVALLNNDGLAAKAYAAGVEEVLLVLVYPGYSTLREFLGFRPLPEPMTDALKARATPLWATLLRSAHLLRPEDYPPIGQSSSGRNLPKPAPFPVECLPKSIARMVYEGARSQGVDVALWAGPALVALAGAIGAARFLQMKRTWSVPAPTWIVTVAPSGSGKSPPLKVLTRPHWERDRILLETTRQAMAEYERQAATSKKSSAPEHQNASKPPRKSIVIDDTTMEAIVVRLADNPKGLILVKDEVSGLFGSFDAYRQGRGADEQRWMEIYDGRTVKIDRKGEDRPTIVVTRPSISIVGTIQPAVLRRVMTQQRRDSGFAARMLFAMPTVTVPPWTDHDIPGEVEAQYREVIDRLLNLEANDPPVHLTLTPEALALWRVYHDRVGQEIAAANDSGLEHLSSAIVKLRSTTLRFALGIALGNAAEVSQDEAQQLRVVDDVAMSAAIEVAGWFMEQLHVIHATWRIEADEPTDLIELIERFGGRTTVRNLMRRTRRFAKAADAKAALDALVANGKGEWKTSAGKNGKMVAEFELTDPDDAADAVDADTADAADS